MFSQLLEDYAERCIQLAYECQNKSAERFLRLLAVDLMLAARMQQPRRSNPKVLRELEALRLIVRADALAVKFLRPCSHLLIHETPEELAKGQIVGSLLYEKMAARPQKLYGQGIGSSYQAQGLKLSKHFRV